MLGETRIQPRFERSGAFGRSLVAGLAIAVFVGGSNLPAPAVAQEISARMQAIAETAADDKEVSAFYRENDYQPVFTLDTEEGRARREALFRALENAPMHGLAPYDTSVIQATLRDIKSERDIGRAEVALAKLFLEYAHDMQSGQLNPRAVDDGIKRTAPRRDGTKLLTNFAQSAPAAYIRKLEPASPEYARLLREKVRLTDQIAAGGWGAQVPASKYKPGATGDNVVALRNRLIATGYLARTASPVYDAEMQKAVQAFQRDHGLATDGVVGPGTLAELNTSPEDRLKSIYVALERERWLNKSRGTRHIWVNITDFSAKIIDNGSVTFETRSVVGADSHDRRTPEFSDKMEHMVVNPTWNVPRSIAVKEYLPQLQSNPFSVGHLRVVDRAGRIVNRASVDFNQFTASSFPFALKQPPSNSNALGLVKFMFPNKYNIYLHDTPAKSLFSREARAFSHGCIRLNDPFDFAYALLARQSNDPEGTFKRALNSGRETVVGLEEHVPVHLVYRTAVTLPKGGMEYRRDVYGRDALVWSALERQGVSLFDVNG